MDNPPSDLFYNDGWVAGRKARDIGPMNGVIILDFGQPWQDMQEGQPVSGTLLIDTLEFASISSIETAAKRFADGYYVGSHTPPTNYPPKVTLAIGLSNYGPNADTNPTNFATHAQRWGEMVLRVATYIQYYENITVDAAVDIEFPWNTAVRTRTWFNNYATVVEGAGHYLYNFGDCNDCYPRPRADSQPNTDPPYNPVEPERAWYLEDIRYTSSAVVGRPLPQIYYPVRNSPNPHAPVLEQSCQWENISRWSYDVYGRPITFAGIFSGWQASGIPSYTLSSEAAWKEFMEALNSDPLRRTPVQLPWLTDLARAGHEPTPTPSPTPIP